MRKRKLPLQSVTDANAALFLMRAFAQIYYKLASKKAPLQFFKDWWRKFFNFQCDKFGYQKKNASMKVSSFFQKV